MIRFFTDIVKKVIINLLTIIIIGTVVWFFLLKPLLF